MTEVSKKTGDETSNVVSLDSFRIKLFGEERKLTEKEVQVKIEEQERLNTKYSKLRNDAKIWISRLENWDTTDNKFIDEWDFKLSMYIIDFYYADAKDLQMTSRNTVNSVFTKEMAEHIEAGNRTTLEIRKICLELFNILSQD